VFWGCFFGDPKSIKMVVGKLCSKNRFNNIVAPGFYQFSMLEEWFLKSRHPKQNPYGATCLGQHGQRIQAPRQQERVVFMDIYNSALVASMLAYELSIGLAARSIILL
jgi:hypothetical protein